MTENELYERINENLRESFKVNSEIVAANIINMRNKCYSYGLDSFELRKSLLDYTMDISQVICLAMSKLLFDAEILDINSDDR